MSLPSSLLMGLVLSASSFAFQMTVKREIPLFDTDRAVIVRRALLERGKPYRWDANGPDSFDCSGFVHFILREVLGKGRFSLPYRLKNRQATSVFYRDYLRRARAEVPCTDAKKADIVFFPGGAHEPNHVGLIIQTRPLTFFTAQSRLHGVTEAGFDRGTYWGSRHPECYTNIWVKEST